MRIWLDMKAVVTSMFATRDDRVPGDDVDPLCREV
jgi:hypothetical protein